jgi:O-antigen ligase
MKLSQLARWLTFATAASILFSIAASHILMALALVAFLLSGEKLRLPRIWLPLSIFLLGTVISLVFSPDRAAGLVQIRKFYVFFILILVFSLLRDTVPVRWLFLTWAVFAGVSSLVGIAQFIQKMQQAHNAGSNFYQFYVGQRITGFMSHWNTFSGEQMIALLMLAAFLFFAPGLKRPWIWIACAAAIGAGVVLAETRAVWIGLAVGSVYLLWMWRRWTVLLLPAALVLALLVAPPVIRDRLSSMIHGQNVDSNSFRLVTWRTGIRMIEAHPLLGLGPEGPRIHFDEWVPADVPRPLPLGAYIHLHNIYLQYAAERGVPVLIAVLWMFGMMLVDFWRGLRALPPGPGNRRFLLHGAIAVLLAIMAEGLFEHNLGDTEVLTMFLVVTACGYLALEKDVIQN